MGDRLRNIYNYNPVAHPRYLVNCTYVLFEIEVYPIHLRIWCAVNLRCGMVGVWLIGALSQRDARGFWGESQGMPSSVLIGAISASVVVAPHRLSRRHGLLVIPRKYEVRLQNRRGAAGP